MRTKADLLQAKKEMYPKHFEELIDLINIELEFLENTSEPEMVNDPLRQLIDTFLAQQQAKIGSDDLLNNLIDGRIEQFAEKLQNLVLQVFSYHDISGKKPEKVYHAFLLGLFNQLVPQYAL